MIIESLISLSFLSCSLLSLLLSPFSPALSSLLSPIHQQAQVSPIHKLRSLDVTQWAVHNRICCTALRGSIGALVKSCCGTLLFLPMLVKMLPTDIDRHDQTISSSAVSSSLLEESRRQNETSQAARDGTAHQSRLVADPAEVVGISGRDPLSQDMSCQPVSGEVVLPVGVDQAWARTTPFPIRIIILPSTSFCRQYEVPTLSATFVTHTFIHHHHHVIRPKAQASPRLYLSPQRFLPNPPLAPLIHHLRPRLPPLHRILHARLCPCPTDATAGAKIHRPRRTHRAKCFQNDASR